MNHVGSNDGHVNECTLTALERERVALFTISSGKEEDDFHSDYSAMPLSVPTIAVPYSTAVV